MTTEQVNAATPLHTRWQVGPVSARPYAWPFDTSVDTQHLAVICIDWQTDFCGPGGYVDQMGYDLSLTRGGLPATAKLLAHARATGMTVIHTREGHAPDLGDLPANKRWRSARIGAEIGADGPCGRILVRGEPGWEIVPEVAPVAGEFIVDKPGKGAFYATELTDIVAERGITQMIVCGVTTEVCVHTTVREANDRGIDCLVMSDCTASYFPEFHAAALRMISAQGGIFGWVSDSESVIAALTAPAEPAAI